MPASSSLPVATPGSILTKRRGSEFPSRDGARRSSSVRTLLCRPAPGIISERFRDAETTVLSSFETESLCGTSMSGRHSVTGRAERGRLRQAVQTRTIMRSTLLIIAAKTEKIYELSPVRGEFVAFEKGGDTCHRTGLEMKNRLICKEFPETVTKAFLP